MGALLVTCVHYDSFKDKTKSKKLSTHGASPLSFSPGLKAPVPDPPLDEHEKTTFFVSPLAMTFESENLSDTTSSPNTSTPTPDAIYDPTDVREGTTEACESDMSPADVSIPDTVIIPDTDFHTINQNQSVLPELLQSPNATIRPLSARMLMDTIEALPAALETETAVANAAAEMMDPETPACLDTQSVDNDDLISLTSILPLCSPLSMTSDMTQSTVGNVPLVSEKVISSPKLPASHISRMDRRFRKAISSTLETNFPTSVWLSPISTNRFS